MSWLYLNDNFALHGLSDGAYRNILGGLFYSVNYRTDNWSIPKAAVPSLRPQPYEPAFERELVDKRFWLPIHDEYRFALHGPNDNLMSPLAKRSINGRLPIAAEVRQLVYARDGYQCRHCRTSKDLSLDHIHPWSKGGSDEPDNLQTLCRPCNSRKGARV